MTNENESTCVFSYHAPKYFIREEEEERRGEEDEQSKRREQKKRREGHTIFDVHRHGGVANRFALEAHVNLVSSYSCGLVHHLVRSISIVGNWRIDLNISSLVTPLHVRTHERKVNTLMIRHARTCTEPRNYLVSILVSDFDVELLAAISSVDVLAISVLGLNEELSGLRVEHSVLHAWTEHEGLAGIDSN